MKNTNPKILLRGEKKQAILLFQGSASNRWRRNKKRGSHSFKELPERNKNIVMMTKLTVWTEEQSHSDW